jgi:hypothetical protein
MAVAIELRRWFAAHEAALRAAPHLAYGWPGTVLTARQTALVDAFRPLALAVQDEFHGWRRGLRDDGYFDINFDELAKHYIVEEWQTRQVGPDLLSRYMKTATSRLKGA